MKDNLGLIAVLGAAGLVAWYWYSKQPQDSSVPTKYTGPAPTRNIPSPVDEPDYGFSIGGSFRNQTTLPGYLR
jgi:hypothetical protein